MAPNLDIEPEIRSAIDQAVSNTGQSDSLSTKIMAWFNGLVNGNESLTDRDAVRRRLDVLLEDVHVDVSNESEEGD